MFADTPASCHAAVLHLRKGAPGVPVWLFTTSGPLAETAALCEKVAIHRNSLILLMRAQRWLWPYWVALGVCSWTGGRGRWPLKLAPFLVPPFRALVLNENGDFFAGTPSGIARHAARRLGDRVDTFWNRVRTAVHALNDFASDAGNWLRGTAYQVWLRLLAVSGWILRLSGYPNRRYFERLQGDGSLDLSMKRSAGDGVAIFVQSGRRWDAARLERFARLSHARWILWTDARPSAASTEALTALAPRLDHPHTFAISRQTHFRAWKPMMFPTAPFGTVPPGAACQVLAPLSDCILVDREKLIKIGIPRSPFSTTAWMILFWKAAAAGWRSYSAGGAGAVVEQPDFPMQEASFLCRLFTDAGLRGIGPREPELSRGAISFYPAVHARAGKRRDRLKVLLVSPFLPYPLSHGGAVRIYNLCRALRGRVDFTLAAVREKGETVDFEKLGEVFDQVYVVDIDERASGDERLPGQVRGYQSRALRALIGEVGQSWKPDLLQVEYTHMAAFADAAADIPAILVEHDVTFQLYRQLAESHPTTAATAEYRRWLDFERQRLARYRAVWTVSEEDRATVLKESGRDPGSTFVTPNGVDIRRFRPRNSRPVEPVVFYVGSFRHLPNTLGFEKLRLEVMPRIWSRFPEARLSVVAGPEYERYWREPVMDPRIEMHGFVEDLRPLYAQAAVAVVPLEVSAGTNIKVLEALACGKAVVTTAVGCAGLGLKDGADALIRDGWDSFADAAGDLLADPDRRASLARRGRQTVEDRFSWTAIADAAYESYRAVAAPDSAALLTG